jgi:hypothetical protein
MIVLAAALAGALAGSAPSIAVHLTRRHQSGAPHRSNRPMLWAALEVAGGMVAAFAGRLIAGDIGGLVAGTAAVLADITVPSLWPRDDDPRASAGPGGGLGMAGGTLVVLWPVGALVWAAALTATYRMTHILSRAVVASALILLAVVAAWGWFGLANFWGVEPGPGLMLAVLTMMVLLGFRFLRDPQTGGPEEAAPDAVGWSTPE